jgi:hypothetical protein
MSTCPENWKVKQARKSSACRINPRGITSLFSPASHLINDSLNPEILGKIISEFSLGFALDTVRDLPNNAEALSLYNPNARPSDVQAWLKNSFPLDTHF